MGVWGGVVYEECEECEEEVGGVFGTSRKGGLFECDIEVCVGVWMSVDVLVYVGVCVW